ncbi:MAG: hypothetical protein JWN40_4975 [Phycisphaerales bacterium]|nr:hypothetical protein [Phycisphaerales bacterium]
MDIAPRLFSEQQAKSDIGFMEIRCRNCVERAEEIWTKACEAQPRLRKAARGRGRNAIFNELVADFAREEFDGAAEIDVCEQYGTIRLHVKDQYDIGFKKVDARGHSCNYPTPRRQRYDRQLPLFDDPLPEATRLHIGYQWNNAGTEIVDVYLVYPVRREAVFHYPLAAQLTERPILKVNPVPAKKARFRSKIAKEETAKKKAE